MSEPTGEDGFSGLGSRGLRRLARRVARARRRGPQRMARLARSHGVSVRQLRLLADAWSEGGASGVDALGPAPPDVDAEVMQAADRALDAWSRRHFPLETLQWDSWRNRVTVWVVEPAADRRGPPHRRPMLQLRFTTARRGDARWHLYRKAAQGEWWPVRVNGGRRPQDLAACLDAARVDGGNVFWGHGGTT